MPFSKETASESIRRWGEVLEHNSLPRWESFPDLPLYMDQVIILLNQYVNPVPDMVPVDRSITPAMINNYVKLRIVPPPVKKRYGRVHLAYLVMVCILKQALNISAIPRLLPLGQNEESVRTLYDAFVDIYRDTSAHYINYVAEVGKPIFEQEQSQVVHLVMQLAVSANLSKLLTEQLVAIEDEAAPLAGPDAQGNGKA